MKQMREMMSLVTLAVKNYVKLLRTIVAKQHLTPLPLPVSWNSMGEAEKMRDLH